MKLPFVSTRHILLQRSLIALVQEAIESKYTNAICNRITGQLPGDICLLKDHLFSTYGKINEQEFQTKYDETTKMTYSVSDPIDDIFNAVEVKSPNLQTRHTPHGNRSTLGTSSLTSNQSSAAMFESG